MKATMLRVWWKVPLYSITAGYLSFWSMVGPLGHLAIKKLPDGTIASDNTIWTLLSCGVFIVVLLAGGLLFFRKMTRKELLVSATAMFVLNVVLGTMAYLMPTNSVAFFILEIAEWYGIVPQVFHKLGVNQWISAFAGWAAVYLFVLFGKREAL